MLTQQEIDVVKAHRENVKLLSSLGSLAWQSGDRL
jgi:hypothetical protein